MHTTPKLRVKTLPELQTELKKQKESENNNNVQITARKNKNSRKVAAATTTTKKNRTKLIPKEAEVEATKEDEPEIQVKPNTTVKPSTSKKLAIFLRQEPPPNQMRIGDFFKTTEKSYKVEPVKLDEPTPFIAKKATKRNKSDSGIGKSTKCNKTNGKTVRKKAGVGGKLSRKRLNFEEETSEGDASSNISCLSTYCKPKTTRSSQQQKTGMEVGSIIDLLSSSDEEEEQNVKDVQLNAKDMLNMSNNRETSATDVLNVCKEVPCISADKPENSMHQTDCLANINDAEEHSASRSSKSPSFTLRQSETASSKNEDMQPRNCLSDLNLEDEPANIHDYISSTPINEQTATQSSKSPSFTLRQSETVSCENEHLLPQNCSIDLHLEDELANIHGYICNSQPNDNEKSSSLSSQSLLHMLCQSGTPLSENEDMLPQNCLSDKHLEDELATIRRNISSKEQYNLKSSAALMKIKTETFSNARQDEEFTPLSSTIKIENTQLISQTKQCAPNTSEYIVRIPIHSKPPDEMSQDKKTDMGITIINDVTLSNNESTTTREAMQNNNSMHSANFADKTNNESLQIIHDYCSEEHAKSVASGKCTTLSLRADYRKNERSKDLPQNTENPNEIISLIDDDDGGDAADANNNNNNKIQSAVKKPVKKPVSKKKTKKSNTKKMPQSRLPIIQEISENTNQQISSNGEINKNIKEQFASSNTTTTTTHSAVNPSNEEAYLDIDAQKSASSSLASVATTFSKRKLKPCPHYKVVEGTHFAVDAFQFGYIAGVTHYFLTHFHMDHYVGLTQKFAMPLYMSSITARLVRTFIPIDEQYIHELELNEPIEIDNYEITAIDANHCPGAVMLVFKHKDTKKCILHTGDFRASFQMESEPIFWSNHIHTIYLDTTYISNKYAFCSQFESIDRAKSLIELFREKHRDKRILYICGSYVIGKEKFWSVLAEEFNLKVWVEEHRAKALNAINDVKLNELLITDPLAADMHVITMGKLSYLHLVDYFSAYEDHFDIVLAIRPSGWEKEARPRYGKKINVLGIEYSEHSSYNEMQRFVMFLKPDVVHSTVPVSRDLAKTSKVPLNWYKYKKLQPSSNFQPTIETYFRQSTHKRSAVARLPNERKGGLEKFVSPLKKRKTNSQILDEVGPSPRTVLARCNAEEEQEEKEKEQKNAREAERQKKAKEAEMQTKEAEKPKNAKATKKLQLQKSKLNGLKKSQRINGNKTVMTNDVSVFPDLNDLDIAPLSNRRVSLNSSDDFELPPKSPVKKVPLPKFKLNKILEELQNEQNSEEDFETALPLTQKYLPKTNKDNMEQISIPETENSALQKDLTKNVRVKEVDKRNGQWTAKGQGNKPNGLLKDCNVNRISPNGSNKENNDSEQTFRSLQQEEGYEASVAAESQRNTFSKANRKRKTDVLEMPVPLSASSKAAETLKTKTNKNDNIIKTMPLGNSSKAVETLCNPIFKTDSSRTTSHSSFLDDQPTTSKKAKIRPRIIAGDASADETIASSKSASRRAKTKRNHSSSNDDAKSRQSLSSNGKSCRRNEQATNIDFVNEDELSKSPIRDVANAAVNNIETVSLSSVDSNPMTDLEFFKKRLNNFKVKQEPMNRNSTPKNCKSISPSSTQSAEIIPASQTTLQHESTPRPLRSKFKSQTPPTQNNNIDQQQRTVNNPKQPRNSLHLVKEILTQNVSLNIYDRLEMSQIVVDAMAKHKHLIDDSKDHIPKDLLSSSSNSVCSESKAATTTTTTKQASNINLSQKKSNNSSRSSSLSRTSRKEKRRILVTSTLSSSPCPSSASTPAKTLKAMPENEQSTNPSKPTNQEFRQVKKTNKKNQNKQRARSRTSSLSRQNSREKKSPTENKSNLNEVHSILSQNPIIDLIYDRKIMAEIVEQTWSQQLKNNNTNNTDHIPKDLLSRSSKTDSSDAALLEDAQDDWID